MVFKLFKSLKTWGTRDFEIIFKEEIENLKRELLPLQKGLTKSSQVSDSDINVMVISSGDTEHGIYVKAGIFYSGVIAGSCCADDPTPLDEETEYCVLQFHISKFTAETTVLLVEE